MGCALVTGGTSGIGAAFARELARRGDDLVLVARNKSRLTQMADELRTHGVSVETIAADLAVRSDVDRVVARIEDINRPITMLINNAGAAVKTSLTKPDLATHDQAFEVMVRSVLVLGGAAAQTMRQRGTGSILMVSSTAGFVTSGAYSAIKAWVTAYSESLANELHGTGVTVTALCPGWVRTEFHQRAGISASSIPKPLWLEAEPLVKAALRDMARGRVISIPTARYKVLIWCARHFPRSAVYRISRKISSSRTSALADHSSDGKAEGESTPGSVQLTASGNSPLSGATSGVETDNVASHQSHGDRAGQRHTP